MAEADTLRLATELIIQLVRSVENADAVSDILEVAALIDSNNLVADDVSDRYAVELMT